VIVVVVVFTVAAAIVALQVWIAWPYLR